VQIYSTSKSRNKLKNILFILHFPPPVHGSSIVGQFIKNSEIINNSFNCRYINLLVSRTINDTGKNSFVKILRFIGIWIKLLGELLKKRPDVCYFALTATGTAFYKDVMLVSLLRLFHVKKVYHLHNKGVSQNQSTWINKLLYHFVFRDADVILLSNYLYHDIATFVPASRVYICPNGINDTDSSLNIQLNQNKRKVRILFLSNLIESKGIFELLDACAILQKKGIEFECDFIGAEGDLTINQFNEKVQQKQLTSRVKYLGKKYGQEKQEALENAQIFAFPTYYTNECFPLVLLEAMSAGLPVISTFEGGIPDIVEEGVTGFLISRKDTHELAEKLEMLIMNPELRWKMGVAARNKFEKEFMLQIFEHRIIDILDNLLRNIILI